MFYCHNCGYEIDTTEKEIDYEYDEDMNYNPDDDFWVCPVCGALNG